LIFRTSSEILIIFLPYSVGSKINMVLINR